MPNKNHIEAVLPFWIRALVIWAFCCLGACYGQGTFTITFDGPPVLATNTGRLVQQYYESSMWFRPVGPVDPGNLFARTGWCPDIPGLPNNGTAYVQAGAGSTLMFGFMSGSLFDLRSVDLAEYSTVFPYSATVRFIGYRQDGSTVTTDLTTDGIIDGTGPLPDFQTFHFGREFSALTRVEIPYPGWSVDNLVIAVPEPGTCALLLLGAGFLGARAITRKDAE